MNQILVRLKASGLKPLNAFGDSFIKPSQVFMFIPERFLGRTAPLADAVCQLDHLVDGLLPIQAHDVIQTNAFPFGLRLARKGGEHFCEHGGHDLRPALTDDGQGAIKIKDDVGYAPRLDAISAL